MPTKWSGFGVVAESPTRRILMGGPTTRVRPAPLESEPPSNQPWSGEDGVPGVSRFQTPPLSAASGYWTAAIDGEIASSKD